VNYLGARYLRPLALSLLAAVCVPALPAGAAAASGGPVPPAETARPGITWTECGTAKASNGQPQDEAIGHRPLRRSVAPQRRCLLSWARGTVVSR
jgi:hypothetical protein